MTEIEQLRVDLSMCLFLLNRELEKNGSLNKQQFSDACQQRLNAMSAEDQESYKLLKRVSLLPHSPG